MQPQPVRRTTTRWVVLRRSSGDCGAAAVEFALVAPVLFLLVFGIVDFGRAYSAKVELAHAAREGARVYAVKQDPDEAVEATLAAAATLDDDDPATPATLTITPDGCDDASTFGEPATVTVTYQFTYLTPLPGLVTALLPGDPLANPVVLTEEGAMRCGG